MGWAMASGMGHGHWGFMPWGLGTTVFWAIVIVAVIVLIYQTTRTSRSSGLSDEAREGSLEILKRRYARGDITKDEYEEMRQTLECR